MKRRDLVRALERGGFWEIPGSKHAKYTNGIVTVLAPRHTEIKETTAKSILRDAGLL